MEIAVIRCSEAQNWIHRQLDDSREDPLSPEESEMFRNHLETCPGCHHFLKELNSLRDLLQEVGQTEREEPRPNPRNKGKPPNPSWRDSRPRFILPAAASLLLAASLSLAIFLAPSSSRPPTTVSDAFRVSSPDEDLLIVRYQSNNPHIHFVWVFPTREEKGKTKRAE